GARRDPRRPVYRSRLDAAVPHRRRPGNGDGRPHVARRRRRPRVRHPRRRRRPRRHRTHPHRPNHRRRRVQRCYPPCSL
ncbi:MAG: Phosphoenolpyruvate synthase, partial [uncultured Chloroflexi bacterium]